MYDYFLGGKDNFAADRDTASKALQAWPAMRTAARENRAFLGRAVRYLAAEAGVTQFLDVGSGLPGVGNVHEVAQEVTPAARVVYVDSDPIVLAHGRALLQSTPGGPVRLHRGGHARAGQDPRPPGRQGNARPHQAGRADGRLGAALLHRRRRPRSGGSSSPWSTRCRPAATSPPRTPPRSSPRPPSRRAAPTPAAASTSSAATTTASPTSSSAASPWCPRASWWSPSGARTRTRSSRPAPTSATTGRSPASRR